MGGYNVCSKQVEESIYKIGEVEFCAVIGIPNSERPGSELVKVVTALVPQAKERDKKEIEEKIMEHCKANMALYEVPKIIELIDEMPLTAVGKVDKKVLRQPS